MKNLNINSNKEVSAVFKNYPEHVHAKMKHLRSLVLETAEELEDVTEIEETLKWSEPSYLVKKGSTLRMDWKAKKPNQYALYFKCTSKLVPSFRMAYGDLFNYEKNRAIVFQLNDELPEAQLKQCIAAALRYHKVKDLPALGLS